MPRKLAYLVSQYPATSHTFIQREVTALREAGVSVDTFSIREPSEAERSAAPDRHEYERTHYVLPPKLGRLARAHARALTQKPGRYLETLRDALQHRVPGAKAAVWSVFHFAEAIALADELDARGVDHLHNHFANSGANVGFLASRFLGIDWSLTLHGISEFDYPAGPLLAEKITSAAFVACVTHFGRAQAMRMVDPEHWEKLFVARCGLDLDELERGATSTPVPPKQRALRLVTVGRLSPEKGLAGLLEAFAGLGDDVELRIVGDGPERDALEAKSRALGLTDRVTFVGRVPASAVIAELLYADAFAMASFMEGLPVVLMEALAMEVPVIAPRVAGIPELVEHDQSGLLFAPGHWAELATQLQRLLGDEALRRRLAEEGKRRVVAEFDIHRAVRPLLERFALPARGVAPMAEARV
ncbi:MAG: colanic acid biosynthesis glycosyltransferase WcaL [Sandaracinus sp.]|nr:colanic acid biosynthesis glycosyltransferase WcaL [Sandaracinus sp.]